MFIIAHIFVGTRNKVLPGTGFLQSHFLDQWFAACVCVCVCVCERERERERGGDPLLM
jgi:hypothetical protein